MRTTPKENVSLHLLKLFCILWPDFKECLDNMLNNVSFLIFRRSFSYLWFTETSLCSEKASFNGSSDIDLNHFLNKNLSVKSNLDFEPYNMVKKTNCRIESINKCLGLN